MPALEAALTEVRRLAARRNKILFVGTKRAASKVIREQAQRVGMPYIDRRWLGGHANETTRPFASRSVA